MQRFSNNSKGTLSVGISAAAVSLTLDVGQGAAFPTIAAGDYMLMTIDDGVQVEIVCCTAHGAASDVFTIVRAFEKIGTSGPTALAFATGAIVAVRATDGSFTARTEIPLAIKTVDAIAVTGRAQLFARSWAGRALPSWDPNTGNPTKLQTNIYSNQAVLYKPASGAAAGSTLGAVMTSAGTPSHPAVATTNFLTKQRRTQWTNVVTTTNQILGIRAADTQCFRSSAVNEGGFHFFCRFSFPLFPAGTRVFIGLGALLTGVQVSADPSAAAEDHIGIAMDLADTNLTIMCRDNTTNTKNAIGAGLARTANDTYDLHIFSKQNGTVIGVRLDRVTSAGVVSNLLDTTYTTNIPRQNIPLAPMALMSNGTANVGAAAVTLAVMSLYLETDW